MKRLLMLSLLLLVTLALASSQHVLPWAPDMTYHSDTLHVTTTEKEWPLGTTSGAYFLRVINPNNYFMLIRFSNVAGVLQTYLGNYGTAEYFAPHVIGAPLDSIFVDGEHAVTLYVEWWSVD